MNIKIFADGSNKTEIFDLYENNPLVKGFTTNPSLMKKAGVADYPKFIEEVVSKIKDKSVSFEVFADDDVGMLAEAQKIASFGQNIHVKIPITNTSGKLSLWIIGELVSKNIKVNVTAVFTTKQMKELQAVLPHNQDNIVSIFAGRISDTGKNPSTYIKKGLDILGTQCQILWASPRSVYSVYEAEKAGANIITITPDMIKKLSLEGKNLAEYSLETVKMFYNDAVSSGLKL